MCITAKMEKLFVSKEKSLIGLVSWKWWFDFRLPQKNEACLKSG